MRLVLAWAVAAVMLASPTLARAGEQGPDAPPPDAARPTQTVTFYGHIFGIGLAAPMPANTYAPVGDQLYAQSLAPDICADQDPTGAFGSCSSDPSNKRVLFLTAGPVQVHTQEEFNYSKLHNEHGRAKDVVLDATQDIHAWFYAAADYHGWATNCERGGIGPQMPPDVGCPLPFWQWDPGVVPNFVVQATLYMAELGDYGQGASEPPPIAAAIQGGNATVIAQGATEPQNLQTGLPGSPNAQMFDINLGKPKLTVIPKNMDMFLVYSWYEVDNGQNVGVNGLVAPAVKPWSGESFPVRFTLPVKNPFDVELVIPQFVHDKLLVHSVMSSPWGSYDVDVKSVTLTVADSAGRPLALDHVQRTGEYSVAHGAHFKPVNLTWVWDYQADKLKPGTYQVTVHGCDLERLCADTTGSFTIQADGSPGNYTIGRGGQQTASDAQLRAIQETAAGKAGGTVTERTATLRQSAPRAVPGWEGAALLLPALAALAARRRLG